MRCLIGYPLIYSIRPQVSSVGDLQLADFKQLLANKSLQVEFAGGCSTVRRVYHASRCARLVILTKRGARVLSRFVIEGPLCEVWYKIRELLYSQFFLLWGWPANRQVESASLT